MNNMTRTIKMSTECSQCCFVKTLHDRQIGCALNRLSKFKKQQLTTLNDDGIYSINTICNTFRDNEWANQFDDPCTTVMKHNQTTYDVIVVSHDDNYLESNLTRTLKNILKQTLLPRNIIIVIKKDTLSGFYNVYKNLRDIVGDNVQFSTMQTYGEKTTLECIDEAYQKIQSVYYLTVESGKILPENYMYTFECARNIDLQPLLAVKIDDNYHGQIIQTMIHKNLGGNYYMSIYDKITETAQEQNKTNMLSLWSQL